jgi:hypothetical protein
MCYQRLQGICCILKKKSKQSFVRSQSIGSKKSVFWKGIVMWMIYIYEYTVCVLDEPCPICGWATWPFLDLIFVYYTNPRTKKSHVNITSVSMIFMQQQQRVHFSIAILSRIIMHDLH